MRKLVFLAAAAAATTVGCCVRPVNSGTSGPTKLADTHVDREWVADLVRRGETAYVTAHEDVPWIDTSGAISYSVYAPRALLTLLDHRQAATPLLADIVWSDSAGLSQRACGVAELYWSVTFGDSDVTVDDKAAAPVGFVRVRVHRSLSPPGSTSAPARWANEMGKSKP